MSNLDQTKSARRRSIPPQSITRPPNAPSDYTDDGHADLQSYDDLLLTGDASLLESTRPWRVAGSLDTLRRQIDAAYPKRSKVSDGTIGDAGHETRVSDHNPHIRDGGEGIVTAFDVTHDLAHGCDAGKIAALLHASRDPRIKYIIWNRRIANASPIGGAPAWAWRTYTGANAHDKHCHISVKSAKELYDDATPWPLALLVGNGLESVVITGTAEEPDSVEDMESALAALGGTNGRPLLQALVDAQEAISVLLARYAQTVGPRTQDAMPEAAGFELALLQAEYIDLFTSCQIHPSRAGEVAWHRKVLLRHRATYEQVASRTGIPWWFVGIIHALEASFSFTGHLHNGDPLTARTVQVPKGRPKQWNPPSDWVSSAVDALEQKGYAGADDWRLAAVLHRLERFNGMGYRGRNIHSPYLWSFSNHYSFGKFVRDGKFDPSAVSRQCGAAVMIKAMANAGDIVVQQ